MGHDLRAMCDAVAYVVRNGIEWRALPVDFPPWDSVYAFYERWSGRGLPQQLTARLRDRLRERQGRKKSPPLHHRFPDRQVRGHRACRDQRLPRKKIKGRGRHLVVDTEGWPLALAVTAACVSDRRAKLVVSRLILLVTTLQLMWADACYDGGPLREWMTKTAASPSTSSSAPARTPSKS